MALDIELIGGRDARRKSTDFGGVSSLLLVCCSNQNATCIVSLRGSSTLNS